MTETPEAGKVLKVLFFDEEGQPAGEYKSTQIPEDPFQNKRGTRELQEPPFSMEQLVFLAETHPIHGSSLEQKAADVVGNGWEWDADEEVMDEGEEPDEELKKALDTWFTGLAGGEETMEELLTSAWSDYETIGHGLLEVARDGTGQAAQLFHIPGHTVRFHKDGQRLAQVRGEKIMWFKRWGAPDARGVDRVTGRWGEPDELVKADRLANEVLVVQKRSRRSTWYGIPGYITAVGWIALALAARDDNLLFFQNRREPRWAVIMENLADSGDLEEQLAEAFKVDLKQPHRNLMIPITGNGKVTFQKLSQDRADGSFERLSERADAAILVSHRMPADRLGLTRVGPLGGNVAATANRVYKEAVISPSQAMLAARINRFISVEFRKSAKKGGAKVKEPVEKALEESTADLPWKWRPVELDLAEEAADMEYAAKGFSGNIMTLREARAKVALGPLMKKVPLDPNLRMDETQLQAAENDPDTEIEYEEVEDERNDKLFVEIGSGGGGLFGQPGMFPDPFASQPPNPHEMEGNFGDPQMQEQLEQGQEEILRTLRELIEKSEQRDA